MTKADVELLDHFSKLLNEMRPKVESTASSDEVTVTLRFSSETLDNRAMRSVANMVADHAC